MERRNFLGALTGVAALVGSSTVPVALKKKLGGIIDGPSDSAGRFKMELMEMPQVPQEVIRALKGQIDFSGGVFERTKIIGKAEFY